MQTEFASKYVDLRFILATSDICELLFSVSGFSVGNRKKVILSSNCEEQTFLHLNYNRWGIEDIQAFLQ